MLHHVLAGGLVHVSRDRNSVTVSHGHKNYYKSPVYVKYFRAVMLSEALLSSSKASHRYAQQPKAANWTHCGAFMGGG